MKALGLFLVALSTWAAAPSTVSVSPASGSGSEVTLTATYNDGGQGINYSYLLINTAYVGANACYVHAYVPTQEFFLTDDTGSADLGPISAGQNTTLENSQCILRATGSSTVVNGTTVTMTVSIKFKPSYVGAKNVFLYAVGGGGTSGLDDRGDWAIAFPATYYVDATNGNDSWDGLAQAFVSGTNGPWKTLAKVQGSTFSPGDQVLLKRGERWRGSLTFPSSGAAGNPIVIGDYGAGALPIIDGSEIVTGWTLNAGAVYYKAAWGFRSNAVYQNGQYLTRGSSSSLNTGQYWYDSSTGRLYVRMTDDSNPTTKTVEATRYSSQWFGLLYFNQKSHVIVQNLELRKTNYIGVQMANGSDDITIRWCKFVDTYQNAIEAKGELGTLNSSNIHLLYNTIAHSGIARAYMNTGEAEAVGVSFVGVQTGSIVGNTVTNQGGEGIQCNAGASNLTITNNRIINPYVVGLYVGAGWGNGRHVTNITAAYNYAELGALSTSHGMSISTEYAQSPFSTNGTNETVTPDWNVSWLNDYPVTFWANGGTLPAGITEGRVYYTRNLSGLTFELWTAQSPGGSKVDLNTVSSGSPMVRISHRIDGVKFHHNIVKGNGGTQACYAFGNGQFPGGNIRNVKFHHNVCANTSYGVIAMGPTDDSSNEFSNNIYSVTAWGRAYWIGENPGVPNSISNYQTVDHDVVYGPTAASFIVEIGGSSIPFASGRLYSLSEWRSASVQGQHSIDSNPLLTDEFLLKAGSPAIDAGEVLTGVSQERYGSAPDIGGYEYAPGKLSGPSATKLRNRHKASVYP